MFNQQCYQFHCSLALVFILTCVFIFISSDDKLPSLEDRVFTLLHGKHVKEGIGPHAMSWFCNVFYGRKCQGFKFD